MLRTLVLTAALGLAAAVAVPAQAVSLFCVSVGPDCRDYNCPSDTVTVYDNGSYAGPWLVVCRPRV